MSIITGILAVESSLLSVFFLTKSETLVIPQDSDSTTYNVTFNTTSTLPLGVESYMTFNLKPTFNSETMAVNFMSKSSNGYSQVTDSNQAMIKITGNTYSGFNAFSTIYNNASNIELETTIKFPANSLETIQAKTVFLIPPSTHSKIIPFISLILAVYCFSKPLIAGAFILHFVAFSAFTEKIGLVSYRLLLGLVIFIVINHLCTQTLNRAIPSYVYLYSGFVVLGLFVIFALFGINQPFQVASSPLEILILLCIAEFIGLAGYNNGKCKWTLFLDLFPALGLFITPLVGAFLKAYINEFFGMSAAYLMSMVLSLTGIFVLFISESYNTSEEMSEEIIGVISMENDFHENENTLQIAKARNTASLLLICLPGIACAALLIIGYMINVIQIKSA
ncbi:hypothetical protein TVAG_040110 [Trichomonas vaginalis G3]|uniref:Uncharacterized protein n=1 Tax=Trichomonas vaginalis (strain ATCC PRA-98 / G3) TaxID=412133 RepID=A2EQY5_TRIV3|nr:hypothetical protein TVAGG3_0693530 [Trichomonas vaginalis G3]EAY04959.1 hypothetical protein TVAG_040110 [Trichomonas vaginalis G3]KAI5508749.1 hypothetical protein TVAGG3_0693530 [Trichomonas vaginalis G3]|eukprot:XP_001317182.1 hypothetical protein [Trichomonas vaginalis G3]